MFGASAATAALLLTPSATGVAAASPPAPFCVGHGEAEILCATVEYLSEHDLAVTVCVAGSCLPRVEASLLPTLPAYSPGSGVTPGTAYVPVNKICFSIGFEIWCTPEARIPVPGCVVVDLGTLEGRPITFDVNC